MRIERRHCAGQDVYVTWLDDGRPLRAASSIEAALDARTTLDPTLLRAAIAPGTRLLAPVEPTKIVCVGLNYRQHAEEMGKPLPEEPMLFMKPVTALVGPDQPIELPPQSAEVHHEGELAVVIRHPLKRVAPEDVADGILGYTIMNDVTARDLQRRDGGRYTRAKGFDTFAPIGPAIIADLDPRALELEVRVNDQVRQRSRCDDMIFDVPYLVSFVSHIMTLLPGDVISTGTPAGVGRIEGGDLVEVEIDGIGILRNPVVA